MSYPLSPFSLLGLSPRKWQLIILRLPSFKIPTSSGWFYLIWWSLIEGVTHAWHFSPCHTRQSVFLITSNHHHHVFKQVPALYVITDSSETRAIPGVEEATMMRPRKSGWMIKRVERCCSANGDNDVLKPRCIITLFRDARYSLLFGKDEDSDDMPLYQPRRTINLEALKRKRISDRRRVRIVDMSPY